MKSDKHFSVVVASLLMILSFQNARAAAVSEPRGIEFAVFTPWSVFHESLAKFSESHRTFRQRIDSADWSLGGFNWRLTGISWEATSDFEPVRGEGGSVSLTSRSTSFQLAVEKLSIDQVLIQKVNGFDVRVRVRAECGPLRLSQNQAAVSGLLATRFENRDLLTSLESFDLNWPARSWEISDFECRGPGGFSVVLKNELGDSLVSSEEIKPWLRDLLGAAIQDEANRTLEKLKVPALLPIEGSKLNLRSLFVGFESRAEGVLSRAELRWSDDPEAGSVPLPSQISTERLGASGPVLVASTSAVSALIRAHFAAEPSWKSVDLRGFDTFMRILNSRFLQFFVWPDLFNFPKSSPFQLAVGKPSALDLKWNTDGTARIQTRSHAWVQAPRNSQWWNLLFLESSAEGIVVPRIADGTLSLQAQLRATGFRSGFGRDYYDRFRPNTWLATGLLQDFLAKMLSSQTVSTPLPILDLGLVGRATPAAWKTMDAEIAVIPFRIEPAK